MISWSLKESAITLTPTRERAGDVGPHRRRARQEERRPERRDDQEVLPRPDSAGPHERAERRGEPSQLPRQQG